ncbi:nucleoside phosphorylase domain-containing protein [Aspergillus foveolatus]|uniref:nucleoside phosphorylase domain-containing protein n=1 Tax=Aspergillus foveolatus TaxID=210207 RepID=UPI003CCDAC11
MRPSSRDDFVIAIICALTLEAEAVEDLFDETYDRLGECYRKELGDDNAYVNGRIGNHNVVVVASSLKISYKRIEVALVVGICGGAPYPLSGGEIFLGDVVISDSVVQYDFGRQYPDGFEKKLGVRDTLGRPNRATHSKLASLQARRSRKDLQDKLLQHLQALQKITTAPESPCTSLGCDMDQVFHIGTVASADTMMKSGKHRDHLAQSEGIIGFEMGGVCDYADSHKNKAWQAYAAATGAAAAKFLLEYWIFQQFLRLRTIHFARKQKNEYSHILAERQGSICLGFIFDFVPLSDTRTAYRGSGSQQRGSSTKGKSSTTVASKARQH